MFIAKIGKINQNWCESQAGRWFGVTSLSHVIHRLYDDGHSIVGVEGSSKGVEDFFSENNLKYSSESVADGKFTLYKVCEYFLACVIYLLCVQKKILTIF